MSCLKQLSAKICISPQITNPMKEEKNMRMRQRVDFTQSVLRVSNNCKKESVKLLCSHCDLSIQKNMLRRSGYGSRLKQRGAQYRHNQSFSRQKNYSSITRNFL